jgi:hypothetical protein
VNGLHLIGAALLLLLGGNIGARVVRARRARQAFYRPRRFIH